jgi:hypothetical protein
VITRLNQCHNYELETKELEAKVEMTVEMKTE